MRRAYKKRRQFDSNDASVHEDESRTAVAEIAALRDNLSDRIDEVRSDLLHQIVYLSKRREWTAMPKLPRLLLIALAERMETNGMSLPSG